MGRLFWKFFFAFWLALLIAGISVGAIVWLRHQTDNEPVIDMHATAFVVVAKDIYQSGGEKGLHDFLDNLQHSPAPDVYAIDDDNHELLGRSLDSDVIKNARQEFEQQQGIGPITQISTLEGKHYLVFAPKQSDQLRDHFQISTLSDNRPPGPPPLHELSEQFAPPPSDPYGPPPEDRNSGPDGPPPSDRHGPPEQQYSLLSLLGVGVTASLLFSMLLAWYFTKPIRRLREAISKVAEGKLETRVAHAMGKGNDELSQLGQSFDDMAIRLQALINGQQRLLHDVSHELRSPLARMQAAIGIAQQQPEKVSNVLERLEKDSQRISDLVGELLLLSKLETGVTANQQETFNLMDILAEVIEDARFEAATKDIHIHYATDEQSLMITGQETLLQRAIENVIRNAIKYSEPSTCIDIGLEQDTKQNSLLIHIKDQGPGVNEDELETIFKPFYRSGNKRVNDSVGLGLTIAIRAIQSHGGTIKASNRPDGGLHVTLSIPLTIISAR